jgi:hypothetical protein
MKTSELTGAALDWAVAKCENKGLCITRPDLLAEGLVAPLRYSSNWEHGGPVIARECISTDYAQAADWAARSKTYQWAYGPTPLIAAMRCYVASKMGEDIDIPKELT